VTQEITEKVIPKALASELAPWELATIEVFIRAAGLIGFPRSIGEIYGILFCAEQALTFDDLAQRLGISRGSVSQGLKLLRQLGAVRTQYVVGNRKDHFVPELSMKRLVRGFMRDQFTPHLESGSSRLDQIEALISEEDGSVREHASARIHTLRSWQTRTAKLVPVVMAVLGGSNLLDNDEDSGQELI
jgi:DNA-binding transcriptional regulator GbsR (MarR family)